MNKVFIILFKIFNKTNMVFILTKEGWLFDKFAYYGERVESRI